MDREGIEQNDDKKDAKEQLKDILENGIKNTMNSHEFKSWLNTGAKLYYNNYSATNTFLVWLQKPDASYVMGYEAWKDFGRNVKQGAIGAKIFMPVMAYEKTNGSLFGMIKNVLKGQLAKEPSLEQTSYQVGQSKISFTMNRANGLMGLRINGQEKGIFKNDEQAKKYIDHAILGKVPMYFNVGTVFDVKDVVIPEFLWVKRGYKKEELVKDEEGNPIKNRKGEYKIYNTSERQARFNINLDMHIDRKDPEKMNKLFEACVAVSEHNGVPIYLRDKDTDSTLKGGASGYFSKKISEEHPKGFIVINKDLEITEQCSTLFHEMGHADMHSNLQRLAERMGEEKLTQNMLEIQAESVAYMTASNFGIETDTSSFNYLAVYAKGFELQDLQKSIDIIYTEYKKLTSEIQEELNLRGLNLDLSETITEIIDQEKVSAISKEYIHLALNQEEKVYTAEKEIPKLANENKNNTEILDALKAQYKNIGIQKENIETIKNGVEELEKATTYDEQKKCIEIIESAKERILQKDKDFESLTNDLAAQSKALQTGLKAEFDKNPFKVLEGLKEHFKELKTLTENQIIYIEKSKYISKEYGKLLDTSPEEFVKKASERAKAIDSVMAKNGNFVEVNYCEQWSDKPIVTNGTLCHPKVADSIIKQSEIQIQKLKEEASKKGDYYPFSKCDITIYSPTEKGVTALNTRIDIGDGTQKGLTDILESICKRGKEKIELYNNYEKAIREKGAKEKVYDSTKMIVNNEYQEEKINIKESKNEDKSTLSLWKKEIAGYTANEKSKEQENLRDKKNNILKEK